MRLRGEDWRARCKAAVGAPPPKFSSSTTSPEPTDPSSWSRFRDQGPRDAEIYDIDGGWFRARWHFSFDRYRIPVHSFGAMRVFNDDRLKPGAVWPLHPHRDVEGLTYVVEGTFGHQDNVGGAFGPLPAGSVQRMTLGSGALHSELNASQTSPCASSRSGSCPARPTSRRRSSSASSPPRTDRTACSRSSARGRRCREVHQDASACRSAGP